MRRLFFCTSVLIFALCFSRISAQTLVPSGYDPVRYHEILLGTAKNLTGRFQMGSTTPVVTSIAGTLPTATVETLLATPKAIYLREYFALDKQGLMRLLLVPKTADNHDILTGKVQTADGTVISEREARGWIQAFAASDVFKKYGSVYGSSIHKDAVRSVISRNNAANVRFYFGVDETNRLSAVLLGVSSQNLELNSYVADRSCCPPLDPERGELAQ